MQGERDHLSMSTGERIGWLMRRRGRKPGPLSAAVGTDTTSFWRYRRDERPIPGPVLRKLADELGTTTDFLLCRTDDPRPFPYPSDGDMASWLSRPVRGMPVETSDLALAGAG
jgi:transcriptional regulator with XRE-family HTH domain